MAGPVSGPHSEEIAMRRISFVSVLLLLGFAPASWGQVSLDVSTTGEIVTIDLRFFSPIAGPNLQVWRRAIDPCDNAWIKVACFDADRVVGQPIQATDNPGSTRSTYIYDIVWASDCSASTPPGDFPSGVYGTISASIGGAPIAHGRLVNDQTLYQTPWLLQCADSCNPILQSLPNPGLSVFPWDETCDFYGFISYVAGPIGFANQVRTVTPRVCTEPVTPVAWSDIKVRYR
jgi:hypothetical protein